MSIYGQEVVRQRWYAMMYVAFVLGAVGLSYALGRSLGAW